MQGRLEQVTPAKQAGENEHLCVVVSDEEIWEYQGRGAGVGSK